eukprot:403368958
MESSQEKILITGITGFIGSWVGKEFLDNLDATKYKIRASVRSLANKNKLDPLRQEFGEEAFNRIEFVEADLNDKVSLINAVQGVQYIIHVASPIPGAINLTEKQMCDATKIGMEAIIEAAVQNKVKRIVVTSSLATIFGGHWKRRPGVESVYNEDDIAPLEGADSYAKSKIIQEQVIREFNQKQRETNPEHIVEIVTIHPTFVIGPSLITERNSSAEGIAKLINRQIPGVPNITMPSVDVRDVAHAHLLAFLQPGLHGERFIITQQNLVFNEFADILDAELRQHGYRVQTRRVGYCPLKIASWFDTQVKIVLPLINAQFSVENKKSVEVLGIQYNRELKTTIIEMGYSLIDKGLVPEKRKNHQKL